jgi:transcriptional regulator with XRE-family HTH domain
MGTASEQVHRFVERIPRVRAARTMSQQDLATASGLTRQALGKIETRRQGVGLDDAVAICAALEVSIEAMLSADPLHLVVRVPID